MVLLLLLAMLTACAAIPQDLSGKMFTFPQETNTAYVRLTTSRQAFSAVTVCFRSFTDLKRDHPLFSLATPSAFNDFLIYKDVNNDINLNARDKYAKFEGQDYKLNTWHSICSTWDSTSGLGQLWLDGKPSSRKFISSGSNINGPNIMVLGQEQDSHGGGFDSKQSFVGMMSDVHMWDKVLSPCEIQNYMDDLNFTSGNVLNWGALDFQIIEPIAATNNTGHKMFFGNKSEERSMFTEEVKGNVYALATWLPLSACLLSKERKKHKILFLMGEIMLTESQF